jgi:hypothetical protein
MKFKPMFAPALLALFLSAASARPVLAFQVSQRPLSDFIQAQGTTTCFNPPLPAVQVPGANLGWISVITDLPVRFALLDYTGLTAKFLKDNYGIDLGTTVSGSVSERQLANGRALVTVNLQTKNALTWATNFDPDPNAPIDQVATNPLLFGARAQDLIMNPLRTPALGSSHFRIVFTNTAPGAPLPDIPVCFNPSCPGFCPAGFSVDFLSTQITATGPLTSLAGPGAAGKTGHLTVTQVGLYKPGTHSNPNSALGDLFPAEKVELHWSGK